MSLPLRVASIAATALSLGAGSARADTRYTSQIVTQRDGVDEPVSDVTTSIKGARQRVDTATSVGPLELRRSEITACDLRQRIELDPTLRLYTVAPLDTPAAAEATRVADAPARRGRVITTVKLVDEGRVAIGRFNTQHYTATLTTRSSGCAREDLFVIEIELWAAEENLPTFSCPTTERPAPEVRGGCLVTDEQTGDFAAFHRLQQKLALQRSLSAGGSGAKTIERVTAVSTRPLSDGDFVVPAGYRQVTRAEFDAAVRDEIARAMKGPEL